MMQVSRVHIYLTYPFVLSWSLLEAMSAGAAIVAGDTDPVREVMERGKTGILTDFFDKDALVDRVCEALDNAELRDSLGHAARDYVVKNYDLKTICLPQHLAWVDRLSSFTRGRNQTLGQARKILHHGAADARGIKLRLRRHALFLWMLDHFVFARPHAMCAHPRQGPTHIRLRDMVLIHLVVCRILLQSPLKMDRRFRSAESPKHPRMPAI